MKVVLLLVTWIVAGQQPNANQTTSYQVTFSSMEACETARNSLVWDAYRIRGEQSRRPYYYPANATYQPGVPPSVSAVCVEQ